MTHFCTINFKIPQPSYSSPIQFMNSQIVIKINIFLPLTHPLIPVTLRPLQLHFHIVHPLHVAKHAVETKAAHLAYIRGLHYLHIVTPARESAAKTGGGSSSQQWRPQRSHRENSQLRKFGWKRTCEAAVQLAVLMRSRRERESWCVTRKSVRIVLLSEAQRWMLNSKQMRWLSRCCRWLCAAPRGIWDWAACVGGGVDI